MFTLYAGPCQIESLDHALRMAQIIKRIASKHNVPFVYKSSFDKANRTSLGSARGVGLIPGLSILRHVQKVACVEVMTDVHEVSQVPIVAAAVDVIQIPAMLSRQTDLILAAAQTGRTINIKKGQGMSAGAAIAAGRKAMSVPACGGVMLCERGTTFGYGDLVVDFRSISEMRIDFPVMFDATHSVQKPSARGDGTSGGERDDVFPLVRAAVAVGIDALFLEVHDNPSSAPSDGDCMVTPTLLDSILHYAVKIEKAVSVSLT